MVFLVLQGKGGWGCYIARGVVIYFRKIVQRKYAHRLVSNCVLELDNYFGFGFTMV